ncbi:MAG: flavin reductase family protein [Rhodospirillaceae bacterium]
MLSSQAKIDMPNAPRNEIKSNTADSLRLAMRGLAKSVVLISSIDQNGQRHVMAATAVTPVSMAPPSMLFCINRDASSYPALKEGADFCINVLARDHLMLAHVCSVGAKGEARFDQGAWTQDEFGVPYLADAQSSIICEQDLCQPYGSHDIFIGLVRDIHFGHEIEPLVYANGVYDRLVGEALVV